MATSFITAEIKKSCKRRNQKSTIKPVLNAPQKQRTIQDLFYSGLRSHESERKSTIKQALNAPCKTRRVKDLFLGAFMLLWVGGLPFFYAKNLNPTQARRMFPEVFEGGVCV